MSEIKKRQDEDSQLPRWEIPDVANATGGNIPMPSRNQLEEIREKYRKEGFDNGYQQGYQTGQTEVNKLQQRLNLLINSLAKPLSIIDDDIHETLVKMVQLVCSRILRKELSCSGEWLSNLLLEIKELLIDEGNIVVYINPSEAALVKACLPVSEKEAFQFVEDNAIPIGGCRIKTPNCSINAELEKRVDRLIFGEI